MFTFKQLEAVYWVVKTGGFAQAASKLHTTQSAISKRVHDLEELFDTPLFDRSQRNAHLTEKGITRLLVEAGQQINTAFLQSGLVDRIYWFKAPDTIGKTGLDAVKNGVSTLASWRTVEHTAFPPDTLDILEPCLPAS